MTKPTTLDERVIAKLFAISNFARQAACGELPSKKQVKMRAALLEIESQIREIRKDLNLVEH